MLLIDDLIEKINNTKTKEYFKEVISSFYSENYRSATVMLYSVVICDLIYKLEELKSIYNDKTAEDILNEIISFQSSNKTSSEWENKLVEQIHNRTKLFENSEYQNILHLQKHRHLCAHPVIQQNNYLYTPNKDTTKAHIVNMLEGILTKPSLFSKEIFEDFIYDLKEIKNILIHSNDLKKYLESKYFHKMNSTIEFNIFKSLWKLIFKLDNTECSENRDINFKVLEIIVTRNKNNISKFISENTEYFSNNIDLKYINLLIKCFNINFSIFDSLNESQKLTINKKIEADKNLEYISIFKSSNLNKHIEIIYEITDTVDYDITCDSIKYIYNFLCSQEESVKAKELIIKEYLKSNSYDLAKSRFNDIIAPNLNTFNYDDFIQLLKGSNANNQIYGRSKAHLVLNS